MSVTCPIICSVNQSQQIEVTSGHARLTEPSPNTFEIEVDTETEESIEFEVPDFVHDGTTYSVTVVATRTDENTNTTSTWSYTNNRCVSPKETADVELDLDITGTPPSGTPLAGGAHIRLRPQGRPD